MESKIWQRDLQSSVTTRFGVMRYDWQNVFASWAKSMFCLKMQKRQKGEHGRDFGRDEMTVLENFKSVSC